MIHDYSPWLVCGCGCHNRLLNQKELPEWTIAEESCMFSGVPFLAFFIKLLTRRDNLPYGRPNAQAHTHTPLQRLGRFLTDASRCYKGKCHLLARGSLCSARRREGWEVIALFRYPKYCDVEIGTGLFAATSPSPIQTSRFKLQEGGVRLNLRKEPLEKLYQGFGYFQPQHCPEPEPVFPSTSIFLKKSHNATVQLM